ncbi:MAG: hypothetical protein CM15mP112_00330 [Flavobacteriales bacterium]|nr:MAG: hypothetical protein CM15mP112_00330 [Flavobacteriales bacterium]
MIPRELIRSLGVDFVEMKRNKRRSFVVERRGANVKEAEKGTNEINIVRTQEAIETNAKIIATGCPFCNTMMTDGSRT